MNLVAVNVREKTLDFLNFTRAIVHDFAFNGTGLSIFSQNQTNHS
ncbi:RAxF-45 family protein [Heyndrickxia acidicola]|uniref:Uncharacterized protein n=1 Tax=Heyndrickxia acidicola TaxID=209389 RepID=A0ABU6MHX0_9BACI|nr:RAxF-45 family protein [Heyndrickxia acidicola]MED1203601.1 hypothetical protein [Heyndrickxia acidicola]